MSELRRSQILEMEAAGQDPSKAEKKRKRRRKKKTQDAAPVEAAETVEEETSEPEVSEAEEPVAEETAATTEAENSEAEETDEAAENDSTEETEGEASSSEEPEKLTRRERRERRRQEELLAKEKAAAEPAEMTKAEKFWRVFKVVDIVIASILLVCYLGVTIYYWNKFLPNTNINGVDVSGKTVAEVQENLGRWSDAYKITLTDRNGNKEVISADQIDYHYVAKGEVVSMKKVQNAFTWPVHLFKMKEYSFNTLTNFSEKKLKKVVSKLDVLKDMISPENAYITFNEETALFDVVPEVLGTELKVDEFQQAMKDAITNSKKHIDLLEEDLYEKPTQYSDDEALVSTTNTLNSFASTRIVYIFGDEREILDGNTIRNWLSYSSDGSGEVYFDDSQIANYVYGLACKYNTQYQPHTFTSYYGSPVTVEKGDYGWLIDEEAETAELTDLVYSGVRTEREPVYAVTAQSRKNGDLGDTYVEVDLGNQVVYLWIDGECIFSSSCVSGTYYASDRVTPSGVYSIYYKQSPAVLVGANYRSPVTFWMPFNGGIGLHDASWRGAFGGDIYLYSGSHGCINLPYSAAATIYEYAYPGMPVVCYYE